MKKTWLLLLASFLLVSASCNGMHSVVEDSQSRTESEAEITESPEPETETETETEPETEPSFASVIAGVWEGSDIYITTIIFNEDGTLYYRELGNPKIATVQGSVGTWDAEDERSINIHLPWMGDGYELRATPDDNGGYLLQCVNGQPWSDETIRKTDQTREENDERAKAKLATMLEDGSYEFDNIVFVRGTIWNDGNCIRIESADGCYIEATPETCEMKVRIKQIDFLNYDPNTKVVEGTFVIPFGPDCSYGFSGGMFGFQDITKKEFLKLLYEWSIRSGGMTLDAGFEMSIKNGRIVALYFCS